MNGFWTACYLLEDYKTIKSMTINIVDIIELLGYNRLDYENINFIKN